MCMFWYEILYHKILNKNVEHVIYIFDMRYINKMPVNHKQALTPSAIGENTFTAISIHIWSPTGRPHQEQSQREEKIQKIARQGKSRF